MNPAPHLILGLSLALGPVASAAHPASAPIEPEGRPNVLVILADDLRADLPFAGSSMFLTPNMKALSERGVVFTHAYSQAPQCAPARASFITGLYPSTMGRIDNSKSFRPVTKEKPILPRVFKDHGYETSYVGKIIHHHRDHVEADWTVPAPPVNAPLYALEENMKIFNRNRAAGKKGMGNLGPLAEKTDVPDDAYRSGKVADAAVDFLSKAKTAGKPFLYMVGLANTHRPFTAPSRYWAMYDGVEFPGPANPTLPVGAPDLVKGRTEFSPERDRVFREKMIPAYAACVSYLDALVGKIVDALETNDLARNTIVVLTSDHGFHLGENGASDKKKLYEMSCRVPLIIVDPRQTATKGQRSSAVIELLDVYPTLCELAGLPKPPHLEGESLVPLLGDVSERGKGFALSFSSDPRSGPKPGEVTGSSVRTDAFRYTVWRDDDGNRVAEELYDYKKAPYEVTNVVNEPAYAETVTALRKHVEKPIATGTVTRRH
ncbi:MAG TPA: sulfatase [Chthoniobacteraceae bacterium]|nr:sulfatase [Chthoniobacteraceae bacterium]